MKFTLYKKSLEGTILCGRRCAHMIVAGARGPDSTVSSLCSQSEFQSLCQRLVSMLGAELCRNLTQTELELLRRDYYHMPNLHREGH
jgi:hypothetical protein